MSYQRADIARSTYIFTINLTKQCLPALRFLHSSLNLVFL